MVRGVLLTANLPQLQNLIKRDPAGYREEFLQQWNHYNSVRTIFHSSPDENADHFRELATFLSQVATCYPKETKEFPGQVSSLLLQNYGTLSPDTRQSLVSNLVMLRNKNVISSIELLKTLFPLLPRTSSSSLRASIRRTILSDIKTANQRSKNHKLNRAVQAMLFGMVERGLDGDVQSDKGKARAVPSGPTTDGLAHNGEEAMWAIILTKELWSKGVWNDAKSVSIMALGCFHPVIKVQSAAMHFFLGGDNDDQDQEEDDEIQDPKALQHRREINKKTRSGDKKIAKQLKTIKKKNRSKSSEKTVNFPALQLLNDPQTFGEKLQDLLAHYSKRFSLEHKLLIIQLLSRVMGSHKTCILPFYSFITPYLTYKQLNVPTILSALAQSVHELTPPDVLTPVLRKIASEFVHPGVGGEVIAAGINAIREVCKRQPWAMEEDLLGDLVEYRKSRDKAVTAASRGVLQLYREVNPGMLKRRERGKSAAMGLSSGVQPLPFGHAADAAVDIDGLTLLEDHLKKVRDEEGNEDDDEKAWEGWDVESDSSEDDSDSDSEGWMNVDDDDDDNKLLDISDSEDERDPNRPSEDAPVPAGGQRDSEDIPTRISNLATTKILTPADFALLNDLKIQAASEAVAAGGGSRAKRKLASLEAAKKVQSDSTNEAVFVSENDILGPRKKAKATYEERMASVAQGREGREKFGSMKGKRKKVVGSSSTNKEKARNKPIMMIMGSQRVKSKKKASLRDKQVKLRKHAESRRRGKS